MERRRALRAVVDTNLFVSGMISLRGRPSQLLDCWRAGEFELLLSDSQYAELKDVFSRPKIVQTYRITPQALSALFAGLDLATRVVSNPSILVPVRDPKDEYILAAALGGEADYLVTGDDDLYVLRDDPRLGSLEIVDVAEFLAKLEEHGEVEGSGRA